MDQNINTVDLAWVETWTDDKLTQVMQAFATLERIYPGSYQIHLSLSGKIALTFDRVLPLAPPPARIVVEFEDEDGDFEYHLTQFRQRIAALHQ